MSESTVTQARKACRTKIGKLALYCLAGEIDQLPSYGLIAGRDVMISRKAVQAKIAELQKGQTHKEWSGERDGIF